MEMPVEEFLDRMSIIRLKVDNIGEQSQKDAWKAYNDDFINYQKKYPNVDLYSYFLELWKINGQIWELEAELRKRAEDLPLSEVGETTIKIRDKNRERVSIKNKLIDVLGVGFKDIKINHCSENKNE